MGIKELIIEIPIIIFVGIFSIFIVLGDFAHKVIEWYVDKTTDYVMETRRKKRILKVRNR